MFKLLIITFLALSCQGTVINFPETNRAVLLETVAKDDKALHWTTHLMDLLSLVDVEKILGVAVQYMNDPEVMKFLGFILGPDFKEIIWELESIEEFKEAYLFLAEKGYNMKNILDFINSILELPPMHKPGSRYREAPPKKGMSGFIVAMVGALPLEEMKKLLETKLATDPEIAEFIAVLDSQEFMMILKKMAKNPKIDEFKSVFESYGFDFKFMCSIMEEVLGGLHQSMFFCHKYFKNYDYINRMYFL